jgi:molecular chaperone GrpE (heat shock protein)
LSPPARGGVGLKAGGGGSVKLLNCYIVMPDEAKKYPKVTSGIVIVNNQSKVFLMRSEVQFYKKFHIPGGHVEWGEALVDSVLREAQEETGLTVHSPEFIRPVEFIFDPGYDTNRHIIPIDYAVKTDEPETAVNLDGREATEYAWLSEEEVRKSDDIEATTKETILMYFDNKKKEHECAEYKQGWQRAVADYKNLQKETSERRQLLLEMSEQQILEEFIPVYDNFKKAFNHKKQETSNKEQDSWVIGIGHIMKQFESILKAHKVEEIKTVGEKFDPKFHETVGEEEAPSTTLGVSAALPEHGTILKEVDGGYMMNGRVIKVAKVIIAK